MSCFLPTTTKFIGIAKERWRRCDFYKKDAVESSLSLLHFLRNVDGESISTFFTENFFYNSRTSFTKAEVEKVVITSGKRRYQRINFFHDCEQLYERFIRGHYARGTQVQPTPPLSLDCDLDGDYWTVFRVCRSLCKRLCDQSSPSKLKIGQIFCHWVILIFELALRCWRLSVCSLYRSMCGDGAVTQDVHCGALITQRETGPSRPVRRGSCE